MAPVEKVLVEKNAINEVAKGVEKMKVEKKSTNLYEDKEQGCAFCDFRKTT